MDKKLRLEVLKARYQIVKDKLLLFGAGFGGSMMALSSKSLNLFFEAVFGAGAVVTFVGILVNLSLASKLQKDMEGISDD